MTEGEKSVLAEGIINTIKEHTASMTNEDARELCEFVRDEIDTFMDDEYPEQEEEEETNGSAEETQQASEGDPASG